MKHGARNQRRGKVTSVKKGNVMALALLVVRAIHVLPVKG